jgi:hypothetical protein
VKPRRRGSVRLTGKARERSDLARLPNGLPLRGG